MASYKLLDDPELCADAVLAGLEAAFPQNRVLPGARVLVACGAPAPTGLPTVGLVSGGGAGHEPFCAGYVGVGMLSAAVSGSVFASPPTSHVVRALKHVAKQHAGGVLLVVANYTGDCLNFGLAAELAKKDGIKVETVIVADDCALLSKGKLSVAGRRGMCGLAFVYKIAGQQAAEGASLAQVADTANRLAQSMATMGLATAPCTLPGTTTPLFTLEPGFVELGLGVHGEAGTEKIKIAPASELMKEILLPTVETLHLEKGNKIAIIVNNLGALTQLEQFVITGIVRKKFESMGITVCRLYSGLVMTSLEMVGVQVCVLNLSSPNANPDDWLRWLDSSTSAPAWPGCASSVPSISEPEVPEVPEDEVEEHHDLGPKLRAEVASVLKAAIVAASEAVISHSEKLNELDSGCGDGDCGSTLARLAREILSTISTLKFEFPARLLLQLASMASTTMGGTSGAVYGLLFSAASHELREIEQGTAGKDLHEAIIKAWHSGLQGIMRYSAARVGDRTLLDSLVPAFEAFAKSMKNGEGVATALKKALNAAKEGCESTATMEARAGRASYVNKAHLVSVDAGAFGVVVWLEKLVLELVKKL